MEDSFYLCCDSFVKPNNRTRFSYTNKIRPTSVKMIYRSYIFFLVCFIPNSYDLQTNHVKTSQRLGTSSLSSSVLLPNCIIVHQRFPNVVDIRLTINICEYFVTGYTQGVKQTWNINFLFLTTQGRTTLFTTIVHC